MAKLHFVVLIALVLLPLGAMAQAPDTVWIPNDFTVGTINSVIQGDTLSNGDPVNPNRVYMLHRGGYYALNGPLVTKAGTHLRLEGEPAPAGGTDPGMAVLVEGTVAGLYYTHIIDCYGDISLKNIWILYVTDTGAQNWTDLAMENSNTKGYFENCVFDWATGICVMAYGTDIDLTFRNCIFRNDIDGGQWWAGRQLATVSSAATLDTVISTNCTFENQGFSFQTDYTPPKYVLYDHNTFLNISKFAFKFYYMTHLIATNNIFMNCHFTGERRADRVGQDPDLLLWGTTVDIDTIPDGTVYNGVAETDRVVNFSNNSNFTQAEFQTFYDTYNAIDSVKASHLYIFAEPMMNDRTLDMFTWHPKFTMANNYDGEDPGFVKPATNLDSLMVFLQYRYVTGGSCFWGYNPDLNAAWPLKEDLSYTNATLLAGGSDGLPVGDLYHWFPAKYAQYVLPTSVKQTSNTVPQSMRLDQNYPNPFNPETKIAYAVPKTASVSLKIFNVLGQEVATLYNGIQSPGSYTATFNGVNLASGAYIYTLTVGDQTMTKKMLMLK